MRGACYSKRPPYMFLWRWYINLLISIIEGSTPNLLENEAVIVEGVRVISFNYLLQVSTFNYNYELPYLKLILN